MALPDFCPDVDNFFETEANRITGEPNRKAWTSSAWEGNDIVPKVAWPDGMGVTPNVLIYDRVTPVGGAMTVEYVDLNDGTGSGPCDPPTAILAPSTRRLSFQLATGALQSTPICIMSGRLTWDLANQGENVLRQMNNNIKNFWQNQRRDQFTRIVSNKAIADSSMTTNPTTFATGTIGQLNLEQVEYWYDRLIDDGANEGNNLATNQFGMPVLPMILSRTAYRTLVKNDTTVNNIRWSSHSDTTLGPAGSLKMLDGFKLLMDNQAARWNLVDGVWTRVPFYSTVVTAGQPSIVNPDYYTAQYEDLVIASPQVVQFAIPSANVKAGPLTFAPIDYMGNTRWVNKYDQQCNIDENKGFFRSNVSFGARPGIPEYGVVMRFKICPLSWTTDPTCS